MHPNRIRPLNEMSVTKVVPKSGSREDVVDMNQYVGRSLTIWMLPPLLLRKDSRLYACSHRYSDEERKLHIVR
jgi:hypothetical protein